MRRKKKMATAVVAVLLLAVVVFGASRSEAKAAGAAKLTVSTASGYEGDQITVDVSIAENPGMCGLTFGLKYDKTVLSVVEAVGVDDVFSADDAIIQPNGDGFVGYMYAGIRDKTAAGKLMTVTFQIKDGAAIADSALAIGDVNGNMEASNFDGDTVELTTEAGKVAVQCKHVSVKEVEKTAATCTAEGSVDSVCEKCGAVTMTTTKPALGHKYGDYTTTKAPTCTEKGVAEAVCSVCQDKQTKELDALGHKYGDYTTTKAPTCTEKGVAEAVCSVCQDKQTKELDALGHKYGDYTTTKAPTCTEKGVAEAVCSVCQDKQTKELDATGHKFGDYTVTKEATDKEDGEMTSVCTVCGKKETIVLPKISEKDFVISGSDDKAFLDEVVAGEETVITFAGIGMSNTSPKAGDVRYVPSSWKLEEETTWEAAPYTAVIKIAKAGSQELTVVYSRQIYSGTEWKADGKTVSVKTAIKVTEKTTANPGAATGEASEGAALFMMCILSAGVLLAASKKKVRV